jgi:ABC-type multidrug transport system ATPase subunit
MSETAAIVVDRLTKRFDAVVALDGVSCEIGAGELFGFIGPDGGGKTTLFRVLATLLIPDGGSARVLGQDVVTDLWALRRRIGYMPGRFSLYPDLTVEENLRFFASVFGTTVEREQEQIAPIYSQLAPFRTRRAAALSGGMKQKLALCCALVHRPELLLLDEPTTGVDAVSRREFWDLLGRIKGPRLTIVVSTPYMDEADRCDRVALVQRGRLMAIDTPAAIAAAFDRPLFAVRAADRYRVLGAVRAYPHTNSVFPFGESLHFTDRRTDVDASEIAHELSAYLHEQGLTAANVSLTRPTIEDAFIARMSVGDDGNADERQRRGAA